MDKYSYRHRLKHFNMDIQVYVKGKVHIFVSNDTVGSIKTIHQFPVGAAQCDQTRRVST